MIATPGIRNESSRRRCESCSKWNSVTEKISGSGQNVIFVPVFFDVPVEAIGATGTPRAYACCQTLPSRRISASSRSERAFTTETPTPWSPPETLYELLSNFPPECRSVRMISSVSRLCSRWSPTGMPRPLSSQVTELSGWIVTVTLSANPACASSIELSTSSVTM